MWTRFLCIHIYIYIRKYVDMYVFINAYICICEYTCVRICVYLSMWDYVYLCVRVSICVYTLSLVSFLCIDQNQSFSVELFILHFIFDFTALQSAFQNEAQFCSFLSQLIALLTETKQYNQAWWIKRQRRETERVREKERESM